MVKTNIRHATGADFAALLELDAACFPAGIAYDAGELSWFMNRRSAETIVVEHAGSIAAFLIVDVNDKSSSATIITLDVRGDCRRLGYGSKLLRRSEEIASARKATDFRLQVDVNNTGAITFYEKHGFRSMRRLNSYYADGHDAWLMVKALPQNDGTSRSVLPTKPATRR
jgi:ribosomal-protein-alanine N-acetyltransferase